MNQALAVTVFWVFSTSCLAAPHFSTLVGTYDGGQMEIATGLELRADGRFRYDLSYGALDEQAEGSWTAAGDAVVLTSDPVAPPRFTLTEDHPSSDRQLLVKLDLPEGMSGQYFRADVRLADGSTISGQFTEEGELSIPQPASAATSVTPSLPIFDVSGEPTFLSGSTGHYLRFRFEPRDLGKVAFERTPLRMVNGDLILLRHDRAIRFRRIPSLKRAADGRL